MTNVLNSASDDHFILLHVSLPLDGSLYKYKTRGSLSHDDDGMAEWLRLFYCIAILDMMYIHIKKETACSAIDQIVPNMENVRSSSQMNEGREEIEAQSTSPAANHSHLRCDGSVSSRMGPEKHAENILIDNKEGHEFRAASCDCLQALYTRSEGPGKESLSQWTICDPRSGFTGLNRLWGNIYNCR